MKQIDEIKVMLKISGFACSPDEISLLLDMKPTRHWIKGDVIDPRVTRKREENCWMVESGLAKDTSVEQQVKVLMDIFLQWWRGWLP